MKLDDASAGGAAAPPSPFHRGSFARVALSWRRWWRGTVLGTVDQDKVIAERREDADLSPRYLFMTAMPGPSGVGRGAVITRAQRFSPAQPSGSLE